MELSFLRLAKALCVFATLASALQAPKVCQLPQPGEDFQTASPSEVFLDQKAINKAILYASTHGRSTIQIFRHNCLVARELGGNITEQIPAQMFSVTKSVVSLLTGIAYQQGKLDFNDEIGKYLPHGKAWGDAAHRKITILDLLTETAGLAEAILSEAATVGVDSSAPQEALAQPIKHKPGTYFEYTQRVPDLLNFVVQRAVGQDIQTFAQQHLFDPVGIPKDSYFWLRDRSGHTYGYAFLFLPPTHLAKLGLLVQNGGSWNGHQVLASEYIAQASAASKRNPCYGWLFWTNAGAPCTGANIPHAQTYARHLLPAAPRDLFAMVGALHQNAFMLPSLDMTVVWTGTFGDTEPNLSALLSAASADLYNNFFERLLAGVRDVDVKPVGTFTRDPLDLDVNPFNYASPLVLLNDVLGNPGCNILFCNGGIPTKGALQNLRALARTVYGIIKI